MLRYTTERREDAPLLGRQHIRDDRVRFHQAKNEHRNPIDFDIRLHPALAESIAAAKVSSNMTFLLIEFGKPFTANGFGNKFKNWCWQAGARFSDAQIRNLTPGLAHEILAQRTAAKCLNDRPVRP